MGKYNIDETLAEGDPGHVEQHVEVAKAINDLDSRAEKKADLVDGKIPSTQLPTIAPPEYPVAGMSAVGMVRGVFVPPGSPLPSPLLPWTLVVETS